MKKTPQLFDYQAFVTELRGLVEAPTFGSKGPQYTASPVFKEWKHKLIDLILRIEAQGYKINCDVRTRHFNPLVYPTAIAPEDRGLRDAEAFFDAINQTLVELRTIIENFDRYGPPPKKPGHEIPTPAPIEVSTQLNTSPELAHPPKVTASWLWQHVPAHMWLTAAGLLCAAAAAGYSFASTNVGRSIQQWFEPAPEPAMSAQPAPLTNQPASGPSK